MLGLTVLAIAILTTTIFSGCTSQQNQNTGLQIVAYGRAAPSGTRDYFVSAVMKNATTGKSDNFSANIYDTNSNGAVYDSVNTTAGGIGYVGIGFVTSYVKLLTINNVSATVANVLSKTYPLSRDLYLVTNGNATGNAKEFIDFMQSMQGQTEVEAEKFVPVPAYQTKTYDSTGKQLSGVLRISGSTTVAPIIERAKTAFIALYPSINITITSPGSGAGITAVSQGTADIGMSSRELTATEKATLVPYVCAKDGLAIIVNKGNTYVNNLSITQLKAIYQGLITNWNHFST
ncbi:MAG TPA: substrate-binding domain-containing protein [Candidatus Thermoplasmatota archaeon]|nr:substrate-binding domain-containing protein [Candidatus Thermoplasmatota archaeon]